MNQARFQKQQREKARREKAAAKWARKEARAAADDEPADGPAMLDEETVLTQLAELHQSFESGAIPFEDFEEAKTELMARLRVEVQARRQQRARRSAAAIEPGAVPAATAWWVACCTPR